MKKQSFVIILVVLLLMTSLVGCSTSVAGKVGTAPDGSEVAIEKATMKFIKDTNEGGYQLMSVEDLNKMIAENKEMIIIDTMPADNFAKGRIPGAVNAELPKTTMADVTDEQKQAFINTLGDNKETPIIVYCGFVGCARSHIGSVIAMEQGFTNVYRVPGGIIAWTEAGYTIEK